MSLSKGCVYFDLAFPPERGYAYVAVSRFRTQAGVFHYGRYRRSDWLPVGEGADDEQIDRGYASMSSDSDVPYGSDSEDSESEEDSIKEDTHDDDERFEFNDTEWERMPDGEQEDSEEVRNVFTRHDTDDEPDYVSEFKAAGIL